METKEAIHNSKNFHQKERGDLLLVYGTSSKRNFSLLEINAGIGDNVRWQ